MKKFRIKDETGCNYEIEEITDETIEEVADDEIEVLTQEEILALKQIAAVAPSILKLLTQQKDETVEEEEVEDEEAEEEAEEEVVNEEEIIDSEGINTKEKKKDSKKSYGAIEKQNNVKDSFDVEEEIAKAWAKRYGGR